jgi:uncharacterized protein (DUF1330 family)
MVTRRKHKFCSHRCSSDFRVKKYNKTCIICGKEWTAYASANPKSRRKTCSKECDLIYAKARLDYGRSIKKIKGWRISTQGYLMVIMPDHPNVDKNGYVKNSDLVMEKKIGRFLLKDEVVHHVDLNKLNDDPDNLMLFPSKKEHMKYHYQQGHWFSDVVEKRKNRGRHMAAVVVER